MNYRRLTPSMSLLLVFEASARHESYTRAADELSLSQSAVSRQVQTLERQLGVALFRREGRSVKLTEPGRRYFTEISGALGRIRGATLQAISHQAGAGVLRLATLPTFGSKWLLPHLHRFYAAHPGVTVHLHSRIGPIDFHTEEIDAAITVGTGDWPGMRAHRLYNEFLIAIAAPEAAGARNAPGPAQAADARGLADLADGPSALPTPPDPLDPLDPHWAIQHPLLSVASHPQAWAEWFSHYQLDHRRMRIGPAFELTSHLVQAVRAGMGVGLVPKVLVEDELARGELLAIGEAVTSERSYYLVYPPANETLASLTAFREWLLGSC